MKRAYIVRIDAPVASLSLGDSNPTCEEKISLRATRRSVAVKRALDHWQAGVGKGVRRMVLIEAECIEGRIVPDTEIDTWLD